MSAPERLKAALVPFCHHGELDALSDHAGVPRKVARKASRGGDISVNHHLRLAVALGYDPFIEGRKVDPFRIGSFHKRRFGEVVRYIRKERALNMREGTEYFGVSLRTLSYIENGYEVCIDTVLIVCRVIGIHPFLFARDCFTARVERSNASEVRSAA